MAADTIEAFRAASYEIAEAIAPTWERRRADIEQVSTPVREWMLRELRPREGDTVLELAAGIGETGFDAAAILGERGRLISTDFSPSMPTPLAGAAPNAGWTTSSTESRTQSGSSSTPTRSTGCCAGSDTC
jgi:ubiquinone/menaquinone biosynthesis C-methylase UbiE